MTDHRNLAAWDPIQWSDDVEIHAILLLLGWGFFIPVSVLVYSHLYRRAYHHHAFGVHFHVLLGTLGIILALAGFGYGHRRFTTFTRDNVSKYTMAHAVTGSIATYGAILQVLFMFIMRKPKFEGQSYTTWPMWQKIGHFGHRGLGFVWLVFALVALETGTHISNVDDVESLANRNEMYSAGFLGAMIASALAVGVSVQFALRRTPLQIAHEQEEDVAAVVVDSKHDDAEVDVVPTPADDA